MLFGLREEPPMERGVRRGVPADARAVAEVHVAGWRDAYPSFLPGEVLAELSVEAREAMWARSLASEDRPLWVAERDGRVVGFVASGPSVDAGADAGTGQVYAIYLAPDAIGRGIGRALFGRAAEDLRARGFRRATLWVFAPNERARRFYEAAGWRPDGTSQTEDVRGTEVEEVRYAITFDPDPTINGAPPAS